jgi:predicted transglutaminase-like protease
MSTLALVFGIMFERAGTDENKQKRRSLSKSEKKRSQRRKKSKRSLSKRRKDIDDGTLEDSFRGNEYYVGGREGYEDGGEREYNGYNENEEYPMDARQVYYSEGEREEYDYEEMREYPVDNNYREDYRQSSGRDSQRFSGRSGNVYQV